MCEGLCVFYLKWNGPQDALTQKKAGFPCSGLKAGSYFISQDEGMSESPLETLEKAKVLISSAQRATYPFETSRGALSSMLQKVTMPDYSRKLIGIPIQLCQLKGTLGLPALLQKRLYFPAKHSLLPEVSVITRQES